jgi:hypothetical protein
MGQLLEFEESLSKKQMECDGLIESSNKNILTRSLKETESKDKWTFV